MAFRVSVIYATVGCQLLPKLLSGFRLNVDTKQKDDDKPLMLTYPSDETNGFAEFCTKCAEKVKAVQEDVGFVASVSGDVKNTLTKTVCDATDAGEECFSECRFVLQIIDENPETCGENCKVSCIGKQSEAPVDEEPKAEELEEPEEDNDEEEPEPEAEDEEPEAAEELREFCTKCAENVKTVQIDIGFVEAGDDNRPLTKIVCDAADITEECFSKCDFVPEIIDEAPETCGTKCKVKCGRKPEEQSGASSDDTVSEVFESETLVPLFDDASLADTTPAPSLEVDKASSICAELDFDQMRSMKMSELWRIEECEEEDLKALKAKVTSLMVKYDAGLTKINVDWRAAKARYNQIRNVSHQEKATIAKDENRMKGLKYEIDKLKKIVSPTHYRGRKLVEVKGFESDLDFDKISQMKKSEIWGIIEGKEENLKSFERKVKSQKTTYYRKRNIRRQGWKLAQAKFGARRKANYGIKKEIRNMEKLVKAKWRDIRKTKHIAYHH